MKELEGMRTIHMESLKLSHNATGYWGGALIPPAVPFSKSCTLDPSPRGSLYRGLLIRGLGYSLNSKLPVALGVQVPNHHILPSNLYCNCYYPNPK